MQGGLGVSDYFLTSSEATVVELFTGIDCLGPSSTGVVERSTDGVEQTLEYSAGPTYLCRDLVSDDVDTSPLYKLPPSSDVALAGGVVASAYVCPASCGGACVMAPTKASRLFLMRSHRIMLLL